MYIYVVVFDFFGKPEPGITGLNIHWVGDYDACNNLKGAYATNDNTTYSVNGKYCRIAYNRIGVSVKCGQGILLQNSTTNSKINMMSYGYLFAAKPAVWSEP